MSQFPDYDPYDEKEIRRQMDVVMTAIPADELAKLRADLATAKATLRQAQSTLMEYAVLRSGKCTIGQPLYLLAKLSIEEIEKLLQ